MTGTGVALGHQRGAQGFRDDGDEPTAVLILSAPGIANERFSAELRRSGRMPDPDETTASSARHDQVMGKVPGG